MNRASPPCKRRPTARQCSRQTKSKIRPARVRPTARRALRAAGRRRSSESLPKELQLALVARLFRGELDGGLAVASRRVQVAHGLGESAEVEAKRGGLAMAPQRGFPDGARIGELSGIDHGHAV